MATSTVSPAAEPRLIDLTPAVPTPVPEIVAALHHIDALDGLTDAEYTWLAEHGLERKAPPGTLLFREGDPPLGMNIVLEGEVHIRRAQSGNLTFFVARMGQISGVLPYSKMKGYGGSGYSVGSI